MAIKRIQFVNSPSENIDRHQRYMIGVGLDPFSLAVAWTDTTEPSNPTWTGVTEPSNVTWNETTEPSNPTWTMT